MSGGAARLLLLTAVTAALVIGPNAVSGYATAAWQATPYELRSVTVVRQSLPTSCGPALIATLTAWAGRPVSEAEVLASTRLLADGVTLDEFARLATMFGVGGSWHRVTAADLPTLPTPFVAHVAAGEGGAGAGGAEAGGAEASMGHLVAVLAVHGGYVVVADPAAGPHVGLVAALERRFTGRVFLMRDPP